MISFSRLFQSFRYAFRGLSRAWREQQNFRLQVTVAVVAFALAWFFDVSRLELLVLVLVSLLVLVLELLNTIFERFTDFFSPRYSTAARAVKDVMAAAVLVASLGALTIGVVIFWPHLFS